MMCHLRSNRGIEEWPSRKLCSCVAAHLANCSEIDLDGFDLSCKGSRTTDSYHIVKA